MTKKHQGLTPVSADEIPAFASEQEEADFWSQHELGDDLLERMESPGEDVLPPPRPRTKAISLRLDADTLARLKILAAARSIPYQRLLKQFLVERLYVEETRSDHSTSSNARDRESKMRKSPSAGPSQATLSRAALPTARSLTQSEGDETCEFLRLADIRTVRRRGDAVRCRQRLFDFAA